MAKSRGVWGIDIGQCALKAMRCTWDEKEETINSDVYDFIEYPKILSQPDANPEELVRDALEEFLSRNEIKGDRIAISVSGQVGLSRFFKPPPVDLKTLPKVVEFEAKQQIPFPLDDVIWDFQQLGGMQVDGLLIDAEVGIFAMKREAVFRALQPYLDADVEIDFVQLSPLATYNCILHEVLRDVPDVEEIDPDNPPPSLVVLSIGTDTTDLVITDGHKVWLRNIPIGGSHFTKQLSRDLKLTYAKAEHLKRNARQAEDPKTIFQAMRPVFSDLVTEIQRSINFFQGIEKNAEIGKIAMLGNASKLPGLRQYLGKHLDTEIVKLSEFEELEGESANQPTFESNLLSFPVSYGLCLQGLKKGRIKINLLPREFKIQRLIKAKKPWALLSIAVLMLAFGCGLLMMSSEAFKTDERREYSGVSWKDAEAEVMKVAARSNTLMSQHNADLNELETINALAEEVSAITDDRRLWPELLSIISQTRPLDERVAFDAIADPEKVPFEERDVVYIEEIESEYFKDLGAWYNPFMQKRYKIDLVDSGLVVPEGEEAPAEGAPVAGEANAGTAFKPGALAPTFEAPKEGENLLTEQSGWVIQISGYHYKNDQKQIKEGIPTGRSFVQHSWLNKMRTARIALPGSPETFSLKELGIDYLVVASDDPIAQVKVANLLHPTQRGLPDPEMEEGRDLNPLAPGAPKVVDDEEDDAPVIKKYYTVRKYSFRVQFVWQPVGLFKRNEIVKERNEAAAAAAAAEAAKEDAENEN